jgi:hypothetical protein
MVNNKKRGKPLFKRKPQIQRLARRPTNRNTQAVGALPARSGLQLALARNDRMKQNTFNSVCKWMDANDPSHLALPRAIGPYAVTRSTRIVKSKSGVMCFGSFMQKSTGYWSNICAVSSNNGQLSMNAAPNTVVWTNPGIDRQTLGSAAQLVPSAVTVQIMNPEALNTSTGILYGGVMNQVPQLGNDPRTWQEFAEDFVAFNKPRLMSAGKICLSGVQASSIPMNMEALAHFSPIASFKSDVYTWDLQPPSGQLQLDCDFCGFSPIILYNPTNIELQYLVTTEYRLRFDISHPAASTHTHHHPGSVNTWSKVVKTLCDLGDGVRDISEVVASTGRAYQEARGALAIMG